MRDRLTTERKLRRIHSWAHALRFKIVLRPYDRRELGYHLSVWVPGRWLPTRIFDGATAAAAIDLAYRRTHCARGR